MDDRKIVDGPWKSQGDKEQLAHMLKGFIESALPEPEDNMEQFEKLCERSERFEKMTGIQAWGHEIDELARLMTIAPIHHKKIKKVRGNKLFYNRRERKLELDRHGIVDVIAAALVIFGAFLLQWMILVLLQGTKVDWTAIRVAAAILVEGFVIVLVAMAIVSYINPLLIARNIKPYLAEMYPQSDV